MKTPKLTRYRLRWRTYKHDPNTRHLLFGAQRIAAVFEHEPGKFEGVIWPKEMIHEIAYEGPSRPQAMRAVSAHVRLSMCRMVDSQSVLGQRVKKGRVRR